MNSVAKCYDKSGTLLNSQEFADENPYPNAEKPYKRSGSVTIEGEVILEDSNGHISHISGHGASTLTKEQQEALRQKIAETTRLINQQIYEQQQQLQRQMEELSSRFGNFW